MPTCRVLKSSAPASAQRAVGAAGRRLLQRCRVIVVAAAALVLAGCGTPTIGLFDQLEDAAHAPIESWCAMAGNECIPAELAVVAPAPTPAPKPSPQDPPSLAQRVDGQLPMALSVGVAATMLAALVVVLSSGLSKHRGGRWRRAFVLHRSMKQMFNSSRE